MLVSPPPQSGERAWGGGVVTFLVAEWPWGRGGLSWRWGSCLWGGNCVPFHPLLSHPKLLVMGRAQLVLGLPEGRSRTSVPRGHRARGEVPRDLKAPCLEQDAPPPFRPRAPPPLLGVSQLVSNPPASSVAQVRPCVPVSVLITALAWPSGSYLCLGPQSTWPPGLCPAGSQASGAAASVAGSCSPPPLCPQLSLAWASRAWSGEADGAAACPFPRPQTSAPSPPWCSSCLRDVGDRGSSQETNSDPH